VHIAAGETGAISAVTDLSQTTPSIANHAARIDLFLVRRRPLSP
jgi:hypothetical protein